MDAKTVQYFFSILEDTYLDFFMEQYHQSARKRVLSMPRFYFFDSGVARALAQTIYAPVVEGTSYYEECFEHFEMDVVMTEPGKPIKLIEIKSATATDARHAKALALAAKDFPSDAERYLISRDPIVREEDGIRYMPWGEFIQRQFATLPGCLPFLPE